MVDNLAQFKAGWVCPECKLVREIDGGPDPCLGYLPSVKYACCGHGGRRHKGGTGGYIYFTNGKLVRFKKLTEIEQH